jgi:hypothetical protein
VAEADETNNVIVKGLAVTVAGSTVIPPLVRR